MVIIQVFIQYWINGMSSIYTLILIIYNYLKLYGWTLDEFWKILELIIGQENKMKYVLVDKTDSIVNTIELGSNVGISGAKTYFVGIKRIEESKFDKLWKVMTVDEYNRKLEIGLRKPSSQGYQRWTEENANLDDFQEKIIKKLIRQVLDELGDTQINLGNKAARETIASLLSATLKEKGEYTEYTKADVKEQELKEQWVCKICGQSSYDLDWDYIGSGTNHLSCEVRLEIDEKKLKERDKKLYEDQGDGHLLETEDSRTGKDRRERVDRRHGDRRDENKLSEEIVDNDLGYVYESTDGGKTIYKRKTGSDERELVKDWDKVKKNV